MIRLRPQGVVIDKTTYIDHIKSRDIYKGRNY